MDMEAYYGNILEEELKNRVGQEWFAQYDTARIIGKIDFCVSATGTDAYGRESLLWAEAKHGVEGDIFVPLAQLILTIGKARTFDRELPPPFLGAFDTDKIAFVPYNKVMAIFVQNDFNWNVAPSDHASPQFRSVLRMLHETAEDGLIMFRFSDEARELHSFIKKNFQVASGDTRQILVTVNNFTHVYNKWRESVMPTIATDWEAAKRHGVIDADFYLADLLSRDNETLKEKLFVLLKGNHYELDRDISDGGFLSKKEAEFKDGQKAHALFWNKYKRPPQRRHWDRMVERRDLLVPQDIRERKGAYFTPRQWVELSQEYLARELGEDWQEEYYIWDCCAGTGNLLAGLTNKYRIYASTLDKADVEVMHTRIATMNKSLRGERGGSNLLDSHVFQFDFLNDPFSLDKPEESKLPQSLVDILKDEEKRRKLVIYINPPYAEAGDSKQLSGTGKNKTDVAVNSAVYKKYLSQMGAAGRELFAQFIIRIYNEIPSSVLADFSKLKNLQAPNFRHFRQSVMAKPERMFLVPASTFDNVNGKFPISFSIWHLDRKQLFDRIEADVYSKANDFEGKKTICCYDDANGNIVKWIIGYKDPVGLKIGYQHNPKNDFQHQGQVFIINDERQLPTPRGWWVTPSNLIVMCIFLAVRKVIPATWLNDRDQFLYPNDGWKTDLEFQADCLAYTLFNNNIQATQGINHWIPFTEEDVDAKEAFRSHFMSDYIRGNARVAEGHAPVQQEMFQQGIPAATPIKFGPEAQAVMEAGRELWRYYHQQPKATPNAALYDIRLLFQGVNAKGKMNTTSTDERYNALIAALRQSLKTLSGKIEPKVYEYGFLKR